MEKDPKLLEIVKKAKECAKNSESGRQCLELFLHEIIKFMSESFKQEDKLLSEEEFIRKQTYLQYVTFSLAIVTDTRKFTQNEIFRIIRACIDTICAIRDEELAGSYYRLLSIIMSSASNLEQAQYDLVLEKLLEVVKYCTSKTEISPQVPFLLSSKTLLRIEPDDFFRSQITQNVIASIFGPNSDNLKSSEVFLQFWPQCCSILNCAEIQKDAWIVENCLRAMLKVLRAKISKDSVIDQIKFIDELFSTIKPNANDIFKSFFKVIEKFIESNGKVLMLKKDLRNSALNWLRVYISLIGDCDDNFEILDVFSSWIVDLISHQEIDETPSELSVAVIDICTRRIKRSFDLSSFDCLHNYLDILAAFFKISGIPRVDIFEWISSEVKKHVDTAHWPLLLRSLLSVQNPTCQKFCKQFAPSSESIWLKVKNGESSKIVNSLAFVTASCHFLGDDYGRQIIPILLLPFFRDFHERFGAKWNNFRIQGAPRNGPELLADLEKFAQDHRSTETTKLQAVHCAMLIEKKTGKYVQLVSEMVISVIVKAQSDRISNLLLALTNFLAENRTIIPDFLTVLITKLLEFHETYSQKTIRELCRTVRRLVCIYSSSKNGFSNCGKCEKNHKMFVEPDSGVVLKLDERTLALFAKAVMEKRDKLSDGVIREVIEMSRVILLHVDSPKLPIVFSPIVKALDLAMGTNADCFCRFWELINYKSSADDDKQLQIYIPTLTRSLSKHKTPEKVNAFLRRVSDAKLSETVKIIVLAAIFAHSATANSDAEWVVVSNWTRTFAKKIDPDNLGNEEAELLQSVVKRYATVFSRCLISRLLYESATEADETRTREAARCFVVRVMIHFKFVNLASVLIVLRPTILYWALVSGAKGHGHKTVCSIIDFLCQELVMASSSVQVPSDPSDARVVMSQRKALVTEMFPTLVQHTLFENSKANESIWKFCADHCDFTEADMKCVTSTYRKEVFQRILLVSPEEFGNQSSAVVAELRKTYENMKKGERFSVGTALDTQNEGVESFFEFRTYFTNDLHFWMRRRAAASFRVVLQSLAPKFFDSNWWTILMTLRHSPPESEATLLSWASFVEQIDYAALRANIWRIVTDLDRVSNNSEIVERVLKRLSYANEIDKIATDETIQKFFWMIPLEVEKRVDFNYTIAKSRRIEDVFDFIRNFSQYPSLHFAQNLNSKIDRGKVWNDDLPRLMGALVGVLPRCQSIEQRKEVCGILEKLPIASSELADHDFNRWENCDFFIDPTNLTEAVLRECATVVETMSAAGRMEYADRTMCEVYKFFEADGLKSMYAKMNSSQKPEPLIIEHNRLDELTQSESRIDASWLTMLIAKCAQLCGEDNPLASLVPIAHIRDGRFLARLANRFILTVVPMERGSDTRWILPIFEEALTNASNQKATNAERNSAIFIFYVFDFLYSHLNTEALRKKPSVWERIVDFWKSMMQWTVKDEHGHEQPLLVSVAQKFGMEKRCILWMEHFMELKRHGGSTESDAEAAYFFTLMNLYARAHDLNGVRGSYARLCKVQIDHVYGKICLREAFGNVADAAAFCRMTGKGKPFDPVETIRKMIEEQDALDVDASEQEENEEFQKSLKNLTQWMKLENDIGPSPQVFTRNVEARATEAKILTMIKNGREDVDQEIDRSRLKILERLSENAVGGSCSYETATPFIVQIQQLDEICKLKNASVENLVGFDSEFWKTLQRRTDDGEQRMDLVEPILRVRRSMLDFRMKALGDRDKDAIRSRIVETHLQSSRIARLTGCPEKAQLAIINAKKVLPFDNKIVLEEAKLQLQTSDELSGMNLLDSILEKTFGELSKHYGDTQQCSNLDLQNAAKHKIEMFPTETKNLFSSVQMLRISHMIKAGNTIGFEKIYNETTNLLHAFVSSGVMYEAAWLLDYLFHHNGKSQSVLPLLKAYKEVAKHETNHVLQARAVERMMTLWLSNTRKISGHISATKVTAAAASEKLQSIKTMNREILTALDRIGWRAFYPAYAILARHIDHQDEDVFRTIKNIMQQLILRMPHQCMWQSVYLLRQDIAEVKKRYMEVLATVKRKSSYYVGLIDQYDYASAVFNQVSEKVTSNNCSLSESVDGLKMLIRQNKYDPKGLIMDRRVDGDCKVQFGIMVPVRSVIDASVHDEEITVDGFVESCSVPDRYLIHDFSDKVKVLESKTKPVLIELVTKAGRKVRLICKKDDDLSKDYHFTKIVEMCNDLLVKDEQTRIQNMKATTYSVIPLAKQGGIIEFMEGVIPFFDTVSKLFGKTSKEWAETVQYWSLKMRSLKKEEKAACFRQFCEQSPLVMAKWFRLQYPEAGQWFACRKLFAKSSAVMSMIGYIFGLGDRHTKNLMVHLPTGKCVHVDFDMIFNKGEMLGTPEVVPFRLTRNMVNGMGEVALDGEFRAVCEHTLRVFRENSYEIEKYIAGLPNLVSDINLANFDMTEAKRLVSGRLRGQIVTAKFYRSNPISHPMQVSQLASSLIELATCDEKLCEMFEGWMPTI